MLLRRASEECVETPEQQSLEQGNFFEVPLTPEAVEALGHILEANRAALEDVRRRRVFQSLLPGNQSRRLSKSYTGNGLDFSTTPVRWRNCSLTQPAMHMPPATTARPFVLSKK